MASVLLSTAGSALGSNFGGPIGAAVGKFIGSSVGGFIDDKIFGPRRLPDAVGARLEDLAVQSSSYGKPIPIVFGNMRLAGNVIWSLPIKETANTRNVSSGKGGGGKVVQRETTYSYSVTMAIAICEGEIDDIVRVWADAEVINPAQGTYRLYKGSEAQNSDSLIESYEGAGRTPAYRGLAYVVIEDFPLANYGNRIPNFTFEVKRKVTAESAEPSVESKVKEIVMIPASGEFAYDTMVQTKIQGEVAGSGFVQRNVEIPLNQNNRGGQADALVALDQLESELPNVEWLSVVVGWFGNSLDAGTCVLKPGVEYTSGATTTPEDWSVAGFSRSTAHAITHVGDSPIYGGTPDDESIVRYVTELRTRGYKVLFYPFIFMDMTGKPWRGHLTGSVSDVANFFTKTNGYNAFINHYASLMAGKVDAFCIGSEMIGLTKVKDGSNNFPAVSALVSLAASVKSTLGSSVKVTYAADWSEYHHTDGGWYNLDPLWASSNIDVIGIDAYFPLTDAPQSGYYKQKIMDGWTSGEGYDWYYSDVGRTTKVNLAAAYAWKNLSWWWNNSHVNPDASTTAWTPASKKIWFTEFGFPSVDGCTNQPNVFYDPNSSESAFPRFSRGRVDYRAQRVAIDATLDKWGASSMVERKFLWTWDARPYPYFPDVREVWADGALWIYGHWVTGKLGLSSLSAIIKELCERAGLDADYVDLSEIYDLVDGFVLSNISSVRGAIEQLQKAFFFDVLEHDGKLKFLPRSNIVDAEIEKDELVDKLEITRSHELELPRQVDLNYIDRSKQYQTGNQHSNREVSGAEGKETQSISVVLNEWEAKRIADISLYNIWLARTNYKFSLPVKYAYLEPADVVEIVAENATHKIRIQESLLGLNGQMNIKGVAEDGSIYDFYAAPNNEGTALDTFTEISNSRLEILDIPALPGDLASAGYLRFAACGYGENWQGAAIYRSDNGGVSYAQIGEILEPAIIGDALTLLPAGVTDVFDETSTVTVSLLNGELESVTKDAVLNGANIAVVGDEIIQFTTATLMAEGKYQLSGLLRGKLGTENKVSSHAIGDSFVLLNGAVLRMEYPNYLIGLARKYKAVSIGKTLSSADEIDFTYNAESLEALSVTDIHGERDTSGNLMISWKRRTRISGELRDNADVPLAEESERYEIDVMNGASVVRTISATSPTASYTAAEQIVDFGSAQSSLTIRIYQLSAIVGRGDVAEKII